MPRNYVPYKRNSTTKDGIPGYNTPHPFVESEDWREYRRRLRLRSEHHREIRRAIGFVDVSHIPYPQDNQER